jgi:Flp pilus assembly protein TadD
MHSPTDTAVAEPTSPPAVDDGRALYVRGLLALRDGQPEGAVSLLTRALRCQPSHPGMRRNLVRALLVAEQYEQVVAQANAALLGSPNDSELHFSRGTGLNALGRHAEACVALSRALALRPDHAPSWLNMGNAAADLNDFATAENLYRTALDLDPGLAEAHASLGYLLTMQGNLPEATEACEAAICLRPDFAQAHWNLAIATLLSGDLSLGFAEYEWRKRHPRYQKDFPALAGPTWDGSDPTGQTILVRAEQGFGDVIQLARYLSMICAAGGTPILMTSPPLVPLIQCMRGVQAVASSQSIPAYDAWVEQGSLPHVFGTRLDSIPAADAYISADPCRVAAWRARLPPGRKIGVAFTGNANHPADRRRSIPVALASKLLDVHGVNFVNLHHGEPARGLCLPDLTRWLTDYAETAALIETLDLVVTVDTSVAHLAGALGKPVWILLPHAPDWRWLLNRTDSPWYRSAWLFRQPTAGDWANVLNEVTDRIAVSYSVGGPKQV